MENDNLGCLVTIIVLLGFALFGYFMNYKECEAKANALGYKFNYQYFQGCVLEKSNGKKVLLQQLREFDYDR
jgi:hypothetical protein